MSSIGEGIDFSQEQQKISGMVPRCCLLHRTQAFGHFPAQVFPLDTENGHVVGERGQPRTTSSSYSSESHASRQPIQLLFLEP